MAIVRRGIVVSTVTGAIVWQDDGPGDFTVSLVGTGAIQLGFPVEFLSATSYCVTVQPGYGNQTSLPAAGFVGHTHNNTATECRVQTATANNAAAGATTFIEIFGETA